MKDILDVIPFGFNNAVTRSELGFMLGAPDREIRAAIEAASTREHPIINVGTGYFRPTKDDVEYVRQYMHSTRNRYKALVKRMKALDMYLQDAEDQLTLDELIAKIGD